MARRLALLALLALPAAADARIVPGKSIAGVKLEMSKPEVRAILGAPTSKVGAQGAVYWVYGPVQRSLRVQFDERGVYGMYLTHRRQRTKEGVGVGSTRKEVRQLDGERCDSISCTIGNPQKGRSYTSFTFADGRVDGITVALSTPPPR